MDLPYESGGLPPCGRSRWSFELSALHHKLWRAAPQGIFVQQRCHFWRQQHAAFSTILRDVCYRLRGMVAGPRWEGPINPRHHLQDLFNRRLKRGQCFRTPCLGWSEFTCSYWGPYRYGITEVDAALSLEIPWMLLCVWNNPSAGSYKPMFDQNVQIVGGVLEYKIPKNWTSGQNREVIENAQ